MRNYYLFRDIDIPSMEVIAVNIGLQYLLVSAFNYEPIGDQDTGVYAQSKYLDRKLGSI